MRSRPACDLSAIVPVHDAEEHIGHHLRALARHLRALGLRFEILAIDEGSSDNGLALLALLLREMPELTVIPDCEAGRAPARGARIARGRVLLIAEPQREPIGGATFAPLSFTLSRLEAGVDVVALHGRWSVCRRTRAWRACDAVRARGELFQRALLRRAIALKLVVEEHGGGRGESRLLPVPEATVPVGALLGGVGLLSFRRRVRPAPAFPLPVAGRAASAPVATAGAPSTLPALATATRTESGAALSSVASGAQKA